MQRLPEWRIEAPWRKLGQAEKSSRSGASYTLQVMSDMRDQAAANLRAKRTHLRRLVHGWAELDQWRSRSCAHHNANSPLIIIAAPAGANDI